MSFRPLLLAMLLGLASLLACGETENGGDEGKGPAFEVCDNGKDDDGDGKADCDDDGCKGDAACAGGGGDGGDGAGGDGGSGGVGGMGGTGGTGGGLPAKETLCGEDETVCCSNRVDDDVNGQTDCKDAACKMLEICQHELNCDDEFDDDGDDLPDCQDPDCKGTPTCGEIDCGDKIDNDSDGRTDCDDAECYDAPFCKREVCGNGIDDDSDGAIDCLDVDCENDTNCKDENCFNGKDDDFDDLVDCDDEECFAEPTCHIERCANDRDEDGDGFLDCADDDCIGDDACVFEPGVLLFSELMFKPAGKGPAGVSDDDAGAEWIEIHNPGLKDINLRGWTFADESGVSHFFKDSLVVEAGRFVVLGRAEPAGKSIDLGLEDDVVDGRYDATIELDDTGEVLVLNDPSGNAVDLLNYGAAGFAAILAKPEGRSLSLDRHNATAVKNDSAANWCAAPLTGTSYLRLDGNGELKTHYGSPQELVECVEDEVCDDMIDNDGDSFTDCQDPDCWGTPFCVEICTDGTGDEDGDLLADCKDPDCDRKVCGAHGRSCEAEVCSCPTGNTESSCVDDFDNDCDGQVDCDDADCAGDINCAG